VTFFPAPPSRNSAIWAFLNYLVSSHLPVFNKEFLKQLLCLSPLIVSITLIL
jgi:hypothetical protein